MRLAIDAVGVKSGGGATVLLQTLQAAVALDAIREITLLASPTALREFTIPPHAKLRILDVARAESSVGRIRWAFRGLERHVHRLNCNALLGFTGIGVAQRNCASVVFIQQSLPYSRESLQRCSLGLRLRMAVIRWMTRRSACASHHVLVQSEPMRETIARDFQISRNAISVFMPTAPVLPHPTADSPKLTGMQSAGGRGALLYVGNDVPYKNLSIVAQGLQRMPEADRPDWYVTLSPESPVCRGGAAIGLGTLNGGELHEAYRRATLLVMPSMTETVGLPMLEAMRVGTPVLAADRPYAHAVCEDAAAFFSPLSPDDFADKTARLLAEAEWRRALAVCGRALIERRDALNPYCAMMEKVVEVAEARGR